MPTELWQVVLQTRRGRQRSGPYQIIRFGLFVVLLFFCSCRSVTYDVRRLEEPILLGDRVTLSSPTAASVPVHEVGDYHAEVTSAQMTASTGMGYGAATTTTQSLANEAQVKAFEQIGGATNRAIRNITLDVNYVAINALVALAEQISISATGKVVEVQAIPPAGGRASTREEVP